MGNKQVVVDFSYILLLFNPAEVWCPDIVRASDNLMRLLRHRGLGFMLEAAYRYNRDSLLQKDSLWETMDVLISEDSDWDSIPGVPGIKLGDNSEDYSVLDLLYDVITEESDTYLESKLKEIGESDTKHYVFKGWVTKTAMLLEKQQTW